MSIGDRVAPGQQLLAISRVDDLWVTANYRETQIREMERRNTDLDKEIERKREHIRRLTTNPAEQELEIRERLKLIRPNEKVFITGPPDRNQAPPAKR